MLVIKRHGEATQAVNADPAFLAYFEFDSVASLCTGLLFKFRDAGHQFFLCRFPHIGTSIQNVCKMFSGISGLDNSAMNDARANHAPPAASSRIIRPNIMRNTSQGRRRIPRMKLERNGQPPIIPVTLPKCRKSPTFTWSRG